MALVHDLHPQPGYPFALALGLEYALSDDGLAVETTATNVGTEPCPYGAGAHPYLFAGPATVDTATLRLPAGSVFEPTGRTSVDGTRSTSAREARVGETKLDHCFTDLERDANGLVRVVLTSPAGDARVSLWADEGYPYLMLYTGDDRPDVARRSLAIEPMSCPPNAFRQGNP